ncbi:MAG: class I SAM-dependent methyltransferase [Fibromonadales bacterium]|nr:class I SAM-dependent methyltransferase [Fibromonadales bacterium]
MSNDDKLRRFNLASRIQTIYLMQYATDKEYDCVLDICAGDGDITIKLAKRSRILYALDEDPIRINKIYEAINHEKLKHIKLNCCNAENLPYTSSVFDLIVCNSALEHIKNYKQVIKEMHRVLKPNGRLIVTVPNADIQFGSIFRTFWQLVLRLPNIVKKIICRKSDLIDLYSIEQMQKYYSKR